MLTRSLKPLLVHLHQFEENLFTMRIIQENLLQLIDTFANEQRQQIVPIDRPTSDWDEEDVEENRTDYSSINSVSSSSTLSSVVEPRKKSVRFSSSNEKPLMEVITPLLPSSTLTEDKHSTEKLRSSSSSVRIHEIEMANGEFLRLLNVSNSDDYDLSDHFLQQNLRSQILCRYRIPPNTILRAGQTLTIYCGTPRDVHPHPPYVLLWKEQRQWQRSSQCLTLLLQPDGKVMESFRCSSRVPSDCSSSLLADCPFDSCRRLLSGDILYVHSKTNFHPRQISPLLPRRSVSRRKVDLPGEHKPAFSRSTTNEIHPDHHPSLSNVPAYFRSTRKDPQWLRRPKSSPFASHRGSKQDNIIRQFLHRKS